MSTSLQRLTLTGTLAFATGVVSAYALKELLQWWRCRHHGSTVKANLRGRRLHGGGEGDAPQARELKLYHSFPFRSCRCAWIVNELGINSQVSFIHIKLHGSDAKDLMAYRDVHPHGTLPSLALEDGSVLLESSAICFYLAECFVDFSGQDLLPAPENTAEYYNFITYASSTFDHILEPLYMQLTHTPEDQRNQSLVDSMRRKFTICANVLSSILNERKYICGDKFTAADCMIGYNVWWASVIQGGSLLEDYPVLRSYLERLQKRPAFEETFKGHKKPSGGRI